VLRRVLEDGTVPRDLSQGLLRDGLGALRHHKRIAITLFKEFRQQIAIADQNFTQDMKNWGEKQRAWEWLVFTRARQHQHQLKWPSAPGDDVEYEQAINAQLSTASPTLRIP
jgi:hypothetical protein